MSDPYDLERFVEAQHRTYAGVLEQLKRARKSGHWIWYVFPQIAGLGRSHMSRRYAIGSIDEARAYAAHAVLGPRLEECVRLMLAIEGESAEQVLGPIDALKFRSCLTLFEAACHDNDVFVQALQKYYDGERDALTLDALA